MRIGTGGTRAASAVSTASEAGFWDGPQWCEALAGHFFGPWAEQLPVLLFVDDDLLAAIHPTAADGLSSAVRQRLVDPEPNGYFTAYERQGRQWKLGGGVGPPPFLDLLALCVLAATRMGTGSVAPNNYRHHLCELLGIDDAGMPAGFRESLYLIWDQLRWWLDDRHGGAIGLGTAVPDEHFTHIGYPVSQTLFRRSDAQQLDDFFRWIELEPGERVDSEMLVALLRAWAPAHQLTPGAVRLLSEPQFEPTIARIISSYAAQWDGTRTDRSSARRATLRVVVQARRGLRVLIGAVQPAAFPSRLIGGLAGRTVIAEAEDEVFTVRGDVDGRMLRSGVRLAADGCELALAGADVHVLKIDPVLSGWSSVETFAPGERHWILASPERREDVIDQLTELGCLGPVEPVGGKLAGWILIRNVVLDNATSLTGTLAGRRPSHKRRMTLRGGLPLKAADAYLQRGAPDLWLPEAMLPAELAPALDGRRLATTTEQIRLAPKLGLSTGRHEVTWAGNTRSFVLLPSNRAEPPAGSPLRHELELDERGEAIGHRTGADERPSDVSICGAIVSGPSVRWRPSPVLINRKAQAAWLMGARPGEARPVPLPAAPAWLRRTGLHDRLYEAHADFEVAWVIEQWLLTPTLRIRPASALPPSCDGQRPTADIGLWSRLLLDATLKSTCDDEIAARLGEYRRVAQKAPEG